MMCPGIILVLFVFTSSNVISAQDQVINLLTELPSLLTHLKTVHPCLPEKHLYYIENTTAAVDPQTTTERSAEYPDYFQNSTKLGHSVMSLKDESISDYSDHLDTSNPGTDRDYPQHEKTKRGVGV